MSGTQSSSANQMRSERDRFVAFAFCNADLLVELATDLRVLFSGGATKALIGRPGDQLVGQEFLGLVAESDRPLVQSVLGRAKGGEPFTEVVMHFQVGAVKGPRVVMSGYVLPRLGNHYFLMCRPASERRRRRGGGGGGPGGGEGQEVSILEELNPTGLFSSDGFAERVGQIVKSSGEDVKLTFFDVSNAEQLRDRLDERAWQKLETSVTAALQDAAVDGDTAGKFGDDRFGVVTKSDVDVSALEKQIEEASKDADPTGVGVQVSSSSVEIDPAQVANDVDAAQALVYTIKRLAESDDGELTVEKLSDALSDKMHETTRQMADVRAAIADKAFDVAYQPIVGLADAHCHHYEALVRLRKDGLNLNPFEFITFAEDTGIITDFDMAMARQVVGDVKKSLEGGASVISVAVNMSGRSLGSPAFIAELRALLRENPEVKGNMLFEVTESARIRDLDGANRFIQVLRNAGYEVCMDDFGAGESAFEYLRALDVDFVKIDGSYVDYAAEDAKGKAFLKAMSMLCRDLKIETIAEKIEDQTMVNFLRTVGVQFGQGYYYGKPIVGQSLATDAVPPPPPGAVGEADIAQSA